jgi:hypothetical protein
MREREHERMYMRAGLPGSLAEYVQRAGEKSVTSQNCAGSVTPILGWGFLPE